VRQKFLRQQADDEDQGFQEIGYKETPWEKRKREYEEEHF
jgi:hypothetical protein